MNHFIYATGLSVMLISTLALILMPLFLAAFLEQKGHIKWANTVGFGWVLTIVFLFCYIMSSGIQ